MADQKPWEQFAQSASSGLSDRPWEAFGGETKGEGKGFRGHARDLGLSLAKGVIGVPEAVVGLADIPTGGRVGKFLENEGGAVGFRPRQAQDFLSDLHTAQYKEQQQQFQEADGVLAKAGVAVRNPSMIANVVAQSGPSMAGGAAIGRGILAIAPRVAPVAGAAVGEGAVMAGHQAAEIRGETEDGLLTPAQSGAAVTTGVLGGVFGYAGGRLAQKLGIGDVDTMLASGVTPQQVANDLARTPARSIPRQVVEGAIAEGFFEELPQEVSEQIIQNLALDRPWYEGVEEAAVMGTLAGMAMGGSAAGVSALSRPPATDAAPGTDVASAPTAEPQPPGPLPALPAPVYEASADGTIRTTDDLNAADQAARQAEAERLSRIARSEVTDVTPVPEVSKTSEAMGINPADGPLSTAAAVAVDSGAAPVVQPGLDLESAAAAGVDPATGELNPQTLRERLSYLQQQARASGWDKTLLDERRRLEAELGRLEPEADTTSGGPGADAPGERWAAMDAAARKALAQQANLNPLVRNNIHRGEWGQLAGDVRAKLTDALQAQEHTQRQAVEEAASRAATHPESGRQEPTEAQKKAGNYAKGHVRLHGLDISIENPRGSTRSGKRPDGSEWAHEMSDHYGNIRRTEGADGEQVDVYVGPQPDSPQVFIIDQLDQQSGGFDEHKVMLGYRDQESAVSAYRSNFDADWQVGPVRAMGMEEFKAWLREGDTGAPASALFTPTHELPNGELVRAYTEDGQIQSGVWENAEGNIIESASATTLEPGADQAANRTLDTAPAEKPTPMSPMELGFKGHTNTFTEAMFDRAIAHGYTVVEPIGDTDLYQLRDPSQEGIAAIGIPRHLVEYVRSKTATDAATAQPSAEAPGRGPRVIINQSGDPRDPIQRDIYRRRLEDVTDPAELRAMIAQLRAALLTDERTGLGSNRAWLEREPKAHIAAIDLDSLKYVNDTMGHDAGDQLIAAVGEALRAAGLGDDSFHVSGDEFYAHSDDADTLLAALEQARQHLAALVVEGRGHRYTGAGFSYGLGRSIEEAEQGLSRDKSQREKAGQRAARGERPSGFVAGHQPDQRSGDAAGDRGEAAATRPSEEVAEPQGTGDRDDLGEQWQEEVGREIERQKRRLSRARSNRTPKNAEIEKEAEQLLRRLRQAVMASPAKGWSPGQPVLPSVAQADAPRSSQADFLAQEASASPQEQSAAAPGDRFANNTLFTADKVAAARARLRAKLGTLNSGIDPELLVDGMTIAGAYIESGVRDFTQYAKAMVEDLGESVKPYLLSFWEGARNYPGLDTGGMTDAAESKRQFEALATPAEAQATEAVGKVAPKPKRRSRKTGARGDMVLTQDWGVEHINGYGDSAREIGNDTKDAFLKETRNYLNAVADALRSYGFEPHTNRKGQPERPVSVNESGPAGSGDVSLTMRNPDSGVNVYVHIGDTALRGVVPTTPSGIAIMFRAGADSDRYAARTGNQWAPVDLSAKELAALVNERSQAHEQPATEAADQSRAQAIRGGRGAAQPGSAPADSGDVAPRQPADGEAAGDAGAAGRPGIREPGADVAGGEGIPQGGDVLHGRPRTGRAGSSTAGAGDAGGRAAAAPAGSRGGDTAKVAPSKPVTSPAGAAIQAKDLHIDNPLEVVGGTPVQRFTRNREALELLQALEDEGRQATPEEQRILAGYTGWGSFGQELFQGSWESPVYPGNAWQQRGEWLRERLGESAWKSAQRSITNAHYTDPPTVLAMWDMVRRMGFEGGKVLEPSMGTGNFFSMMPAELKARSQLTGIELDETTGAIAKQLFPRSNIRIMGYEKSQTPDGFYDLVIGNWPFENTPVADRRYNKLNPMLHDYFFLKTVDQARPGGIVIGITSAGSLDKQNTAIRRELARKAELVAAIRLPSGAFADYAGTKVVTDIVILRKRPERLVAVPPDAIWTETTTVDTPSGQPVRINRYFAENPQHILGTLDHGHGTTTFRAGMIVHRPENMAQRLQEAVSLVPEGAFQPSAQTDHLSYYANETGERHGALAEVNGELMIAVGDQLVVANERTRYQLKDAKRTAEREQQLKEAINLRQLHTVLVDTERRGEDAEAARQALREAYQGFVAAHGPLRESFALTYLERIEDPFFAELAALEDDDGKPAAVLERSTTRARRQIENPSVRDAYVLARNQSVTPSMEAVAKLAGKSVAEVRAELLESGAVFAAPNGDIIPSDIYLSGNVREKMREALAAQAEGIAGMERNIAALQEVMPEDVPYFNIETKLGATWVPTEIYAQYIAHMLSRDSTEGIEVAFRNGRWRVRVDNQLARLPEASTNYGTEHYKFGPLVQAALSNQVLRLTAKDSDGNEHYDAARSEEVNARVSKIREDFAAWVWSDPERRVDLEREYNESRNAWATPRYDGSFLTFEGMALTLGEGEFNLRQHQANAIWRGIVNRRSINAHEVGTGKTFTMGGIAIESRRYGIAKKPLLLAHNANSATVAKEIRMMYPSARVLYVDNLQPRYRDVRLRQIANDDWDVVVVPHSLIDRMALREETLMQLAEEEIAALEQEFFEAAAEDGVNVDKIDLDDDESINKVRSITAKELAKARKRIIENIKKQAQQSSREGAISFEDLGVDMILVDEVHEFKKPPIVTRMRMKGLNTDVSARSIALQFLTRYVRQMNNGGNVHTFTGTPITNTITEIYHQMRYVMDAEMEQANVSDWDGWFGSFATEVQDVELSAAGDYEMTTRLAGFVNVPELRQMVGQYMDTVFAEDMPEMQPRRTQSGKQLSDPNLTEAERAELLNGRTEGAMDRPYKKVVNATADMTEAQVAIFQQLQQYAREWRDADGKTRREWMREGDPRSPLVTEGMANKASLDVRLLDESLAGQEGKAPDDPNSKASRVVANTLEIYNSAPNANQVIFADQGFSKVVRRSRRDANGERYTEAVKVFSTIHDIVERLVQGGIPREQIAIVDGSVNREKRREIAEAMNENRIRVVIGNTDTLGVGVNMQRNLRAMHHLDAPYMPGELEQRNGRGHRQGNQWNTVLEYRYMTDRLDGRRWQILAVKQRFINSFMKSDGVTRVIEGEAAADEQSDILESFSEAAGDPRILQRVKLQGRLEGLQRRERLYTEGIADMRRQVRRSQEEAERLQRQLDQFAEQRTAERIAQLIERQRSDFTATIAGQTYTTRKEATAALNAYIEEKVRVGTQAHQIGSYGGQELQVAWPQLQDTPITTIVAYGQSFGGRGLAGAEARLRNFPQQVERLEAGLAAAQDTVENMRRAMEQPFGRAEELERTAQQLADLEHDLAANPVPPPAWLRQGAPVDAEVYRNGRRYVVTGHRYNADGWFVLAEDEQGATVIPYLEAKDATGMELYEEREFVPPEVISQSGAEGSQAPESEVSYSFAGRQAQGANLHALRTAQERLASGQDPEVVRQETGWHRGVDGKWRYEISDHQASLRHEGATFQAILQAAQQASAGRPVVVADLLEHPQLFAAYPHLAGIPVALMPAGVRSTARLQVRRSGMTVYVHPRAQGSRVTSALLHELQHAIQVREGFAFGGTKQQAAEMAEGGADTYRRLAGEVEARNTQARRLLPPEFRAGIAPEATADVAASDVIVTLNGKRVYEPPHGGIVPPSQAINRERLERAFRQQFPELAPALRKMLARGNRNERGGLVVLDSADPLLIAREFARRTGRPLAESIQLFDGDGVIHGFYDAPSGLTFLVGPNVNIVTAPAVVLHEMVHSRQRQQIDRQALAMLQGRNKVQDPNLRAFLDRVAARMAEVGEADNPAEAAAYLVELAVQEGRSQGYTLADKRFYRFIERTLGKPVADLLQRFVAMVRQWMLRHGLPIGQISVDDLVEYAKGGMRAAARRETDSGSAVRFSQNEASAQFARAPAIESEAFKNWFGDWTDGRSRVLAPGAEGGDAGGAGGADRAAAQGGVGLVGSDGRPRVFYHGTSENIEAFELDHPTRKDNGWLGRGIYVTSDERLAAAYARLKRGAAAPNVMPLYVAVKNPYVADLAFKERMRSLTQAGVDEITRRLKAAGHDGVVLEYGDGTQEVVAFAPTQVKSAIGNRGTFDPTNPDIRFSRSGVHALTGRAIEELNHTFSHPGKVSWWHKSVGTMYNLAQRAPAFKPVFEAAQGFIDDVAYYAADASELAPQLLPRLESWRDIARSPIRAGDNQAIAKPIFEGTLLWTRDQSGAPIRVDDWAARAATLTTEQKVQELLEADRLPEGMLKAWRAHGPQRFAAMVEARYESQFLKAGIVWSDAELKRLFQLDDDQVALYREFRAATDRSLDTMGRADMLRFLGEDGKALRRQVMDAADIREAAVIIRQHLAEQIQFQPERESSLMALAHGVQERADRVAQLQAEGYAPLSRFGRYTVDVVVDGERQYFSLFESRREANKMAEAMRAEFGAENVTQGTLSNEAFKLFAGITPESLELFGNMLGLDASGDSAQDQVFQEYLRLTKTNRSAMKRLIHRKGIAGYSEDAGRVLASFVYSNARQTAAGLNMGDLNEAIAAIPQRQGELKDVAVRLAEYIKNPQEEAQAIRGLLFAQYLGGSVASAFVNITQPVAVTFPWLSQYGGARKAAAAISKAARDMSTRGFAYEADLAQALREAEADGVVSPQEVHQLMAQARGHGSLRAGDGTRVGEARAMASNAVSRLALAWGKLFGAAEQANRRVTFISAYRVAREQGLPDPATFARNAVRETQFVYSKANKMQWGRGAVGGTVMTFKTYSIAYLELMHRLWHQGAPGSMERREGRKAALLMVGTLMLMGGAGGLPFMEDIEDLIDGAAQLMGYNFSSRQAKDEFLEMLFGEALAEFIDKGISGLPGAPMDVSGRLGLGNMIPGTGLFQERSSHTRDVLEVVGPMGDFASRIVSGSRRVLGGEVGAGLLEMSPVAVRNLAQGADMAARGMYRDRKGYKVLDTNHLEAALKAVGFQPASVSRIQEANWINQRAKNFYNTKAQEIRALWAEGIFEKNPRKVERARQQIAEWNRKNPDQPMIIRVPDVMRRVREMGKTKDQRIADTAPRAMRARMREETARLREALE